MEDSCDNYPATGGAACLALPLYAAGGKMIAAFSVTVLAYEWESLPIEDVLRVMRESRVMVR